MTLIRRTITIDNHLDAKIRRIQAATIKETEANCSYSRALCMLIEKGMKS